MIVSVRKGVFLLMEKHMAPGLCENMDYLNETLKVDQSFDIICRKIRIGGREACLAFIDGFCKDELMEKILEHFLEVEEKDMPEDAQGLSKGFVPYVEVEL